MGGFTLIGLGAPSGTGQAARWDDVKAVIPSGSVMPFFQAAAPAGWTQITTYNDCALRVVSGTGGGSTGTVGLSAFIAAGALSHVLTVAEMPAHNHTATDSGHSHTYHSSLIFYGSGGLGATSNSGSGSTTDNGTANITVANNGGGGGHVHALSALQYLDFIICSKN